MAYISKGLSVKSSGMSGQSANEWLLDSEDNTATVNTAGYITDAAAPAGSPASTGKGMAVGDLVYHRQWTAFGPTQYDTTGPLLSGTVMFVASIAADGSADLTDGTAIVTTDTD